MRDKIKLVSSAGTGYFYTSTKNKKKTTKRLELNKFCRACKKHVVHRETK